MQQQGVHAGRVDCCGDARHSRRLPLGEGGGRIGLGRRAEPIEPTRIGTFGGEGDLPVIRHALERGHGGAGHTHQIGCRQFPTQRHQLGQHRRATAAGRIGTRHGAGHHALPPLACWGTQRPRAIRSAPERPLCPGRQYQFEACAQRAQRAPGHPGGEREQIGRHHWGVHHSGNRLQASGVRGRVARHHHAQHSARPQPHGHQRPGYHGRIQRGGHRVVQRPVQGAGGDKGDDLRGRPPIAHISRRRPGRCRCSPT